MGACCAPPPRARPFVVGYVECTIWQLEAMCIKGTTSLWCSCWCMVMPPSSHAPLALLQDLMKTAADLWFPVPSDEEMYAAAPYYGVDKTLCKTLMQR